ncbi:MAG TPA: hypothetical protein PKA37_16745, partial [Planctomycetota bacterium]|nr:hypothetical protein [Planctomycetota bacterium]
MLIEQASVDHQIIDEGVRKGISSQTGGCFFRLSLLAAVLLLTVAVSPGQVGANLPQPSWVGEPSPVPMPPQLQGRRVHKEESACERTPVVRVGDFEFSGARNSGLLAVEKWGTEFHPGTTDTKTILTKYGSLDTGLSSVLHLADARESDLFSLLGNFLIITGLDKDGTPRCHVWIPQQGALPSSGQIIDTGIAFPAGFIPVCVGLVRGYLYAFSPMEPKFLRYRDSNADLVPDQVDPSFVCDFTNDPEPDIGGFSHFGRSQTCDLLLQLPANFSISTSGLVAISPPPAKGNTHEVRPVLSQLGEAEAPTAAQQAPNLFSVVVTGSTVSHAYAVPGSQVTLEVADAGNPPWTVLMGPITVPPTGFGRFVGHR